jgi:hypothetical protein
VPIDIVTMTKNYVISYQNGKATRYSLKSYIAEYRLFQKVTEIRIFRTYKKWYDIRT